MGTGAGPDAGASGSIVAYEAFVGWAPPASPDHRPWGRRLPLGKRAQILRKEVGLVERHLVAGTLLCGAPLGRCRSLLPLGVRVCAGLSARPFFAARHEVMPGDSLAQHVGPAPAGAGPYVAATGRPFSHGLLPPPPRGGGTAPAIRQEAPMGAAQECSARGSAAQPPAVSGQRHSGRALPGAWGAIVPQV